MSKYRRKTANLRERMRMGEINTAFESLREKIPTPLSTSKGRCEKLTKINILHVAINYIRALESILDTGDAGVQVALKIGFDGLIVLYSGPSLDPASVFKYAEELVQVEVFQSGLSGIQPL
jgi:hypothetical protein